MSKSARSETKGQGKREQEADEILEGDDELFMRISVQEKAAWEKMMKSRIESLKNNQVEFQKWRDNLTRRRMFVHSRVRKLYAAQMDRLRFMLKMAETVNAIKDSKKDSSGSDDGGDSHHDENDNKSTANIPDISNEGNDSAVNENGAQSSNPNIVVTSADKTTQPGNVSANENTNNQNGEIDFRATDSHKATNGDLPTISEEEVVNESPRED